MSPGGRFTFPPSSAASKLLYRRFPVGMARKHGHAREYGRPAGWKHCETAGWKPALIGQARLSVSHEDTLFPLPMLNLTRVGSPVVRRCGSSGRTFWFWSRESARNASNRPRMFPLPRWRKGIIETHGDIANEEAAGIRDFEASRSAAHQAISLEARERFNFILEMRCKIKAQTLRHGGIIERQITHYAHDGVAADFVFIAHDVAAGQGCAARVEGGVVFGQVLFVLPISIRDLGDRGHAKGVYVRAGAGAVALEIALEGFLALG